MRNWNRNNDSTNMHACFNECADAQRKLDSFKKNSFFLLIWTLLCTATDFGLNVPFYNKKTAK